MNNLKNKVEQHLKNELDIMEAVLKLNKEDTEIFYNWYINHPYAKGIREVVEIVRGGADK